MNITKVLLACSLLLSGCYSPPVVEVFPRHVIYVEVDRQPMYGYNHCLHIVESLDTRTTLRQWIRPEFRRFEDMKFRTRVLQLQEECYYVTYVR